VPTSSANTENNDLLFQQSLQLMEQNAQFRNQLYIRVAERVTMITRFGLLMLVIIAVSIYLLLNTLNSQVIHMFEGVRTMNQSFTQVVGNMGQIQGDLEAISLQTSLMPDIAQHTGDVARTMLEVDLAIDQAYDSIHRIRLGMQTIDQSMQQTNRQMYPLTRNIYGISHDMGKVSDPFETFNRLFP
jgi:hypothetical protein